MTATLTDAHIDEPAAVAREVAVEDVGEEPEAVREEAPDKTKAMVSVY